MPHILNALRGRSGSGLTACLALLSVAVAASAQPADNRNSVIPRVGDYIRVDPSFAFQGQTGLFPEYARTYTPLAGIGSSGLTQQGALVVRRLGPAIPLERLTRFAGGYLAAFRSDRCKALSAEPVDGVAEPEVHRLSLLFRVQCGADDDGAGYWLRFIATRTGLFLTERPASSAAGDRDTAGVPPVVHICDVRLEAQCALDRPAREAGTAEGWLDLRAPTYDANADLAVLTIDSRTDDLLDPETLERAQLAVSGLLTAGAEGVRVRCLAASPVTGAGRETVYGFLVLLEAGLREADQIAEARLRFYGMRASETTNRSAETAAR